MDTVSKPFKVLSHAVLIFFSILVILPILIMLSSSFTEESILITQGYSIFPSEFSTLAYKYIFSGANSIFSAYGITLSVTFIGVGVGLSISIMLAYALSIEELPGRKFLMFFVFFAMLFNGGLVSTYLMYTGVFHIKNTIWALIIPSLLVSPFMVMLARNFFSTNVPKEVVEASRIDGAGEFILFFKIVLPMAVPIIATIGIMMGLSYWNNWTNGLYYITKSNLYSVQQLLNQMLMSSQSVADAAALGGDASSMPTTALKMATAVSGVIPIMVVYPFFQKYFVKGIAMGAVKG